MQRSIDRCIDPFLGTKFHFNPTILQNPIRMQQDDLTLSNLMNFTSNEVPYVSSTKTTYYYLLDTVCKSTCVGAGPPVFQLI